MLSSIFKGFFFGAVLVFGFVLVANLSGGNTSFLQSMKDIGFGLMILLGGFTATANYMLYLTANNADKAIRKYLIVAIALPALSSFLLLFIGTGEIYTESLVANIVLLIIITIVLGAFNFLMTGFMHMIIAATKRKH